MLAVIVLYDSLELSYLKTFFTNSESFFSIAKKFFTIEITYLSLAVPPKNIICFGFRVCYHYYVIIRVFGIYLKKCFICIMLPWIRNKRYFLAEEQDHVSSGVNIKVNFCRLAWWRSKIYSKTAAVFCVRIFEAFPSDYILGLPLITTILQIV